ncbi:MAG: FAD-dependent oxidoreductase [Candidatus Magasanikbacteria bacterium]|jgi:alkyl hydroperoxide reductase subunit AhpF|nr:FAD-dependent oxidoreductase [Candidatus Magasanikbacteria bacterium]
MDEQCYDVVIIGAAAAGSAAGVYCARRNLNTIIVSMDIGGEVALSGEVENWPGIINITGFELAQNFNKHVLSYNVPIDQGFKVEAIKQEKNYHIVEAKNLSGEERSYKTKAVIIASGIHPRELGLPGEKELKGRGVTYCTVCDGPLFKGKTTITIGAGSAALESALMMGEIAEKVYLVTKYGPEDGKDGFPKGEDVLIEKVKANAKIEIIHNAITTKINGEQKVAGITYKDKKTDAESTIEADGVMVHIGAIPNSDYIECASKNAAGEVEVDMLCKTSCTGIFAAGDVTNIPYKQISISAGQGATAALSAIDYLNRWEEQK